MGLMTSNSLDFTEWTNFQGWLVMIIIKTNVFVNVADD